MTDAERASLAAQLRPLTKGWPDDLLDSRRPVFLSRARPGVGTVWYALARSARQAREVREYLLAFVGSSYSNFIGQPAEWDRTDPLEGALADSLPHGFRVLARAGDADTVAKLFTRLREMLRERPARDHADSPPLGRLLRDFELHLRASDWPAATAQLDRLRDRGQLTTDQLAGLRLRLLAGQEQWGEVLGAPELPGLVAGRLPLSVGEAIAAAVFHEHLAKFATEAETVAHFRESVALVFGALFRQRAAWRHPDAMKVAAIADAALRPAPVVMPVAPESDPLTLALDAQRANDSGRALELLLPGPFTAESLRLLVEVALDLNTRDAARSALSAVRGSVATVREAAFARRTAKKLLGDLEDVAAEDTAPADWLGWLTHAAAGEWPEAAEEAQRGLTAWTRPEPAAFNTLLTQHAGAAFPAIREALPELLKLLLPDGEPDPRFGPSYRVLLERLVLDDDLSPTTAPAVAEFAGAVLCSDPSASAVRNDYAEVVEYLATAWTHLRRTALFDWGLGILDLAAEHAIHRNTNVAPLAQDVAAELARAPRLVTPGQWALLRAVCAELEVPAAAELLVVPAEPGAPVPADEALALRKKLGKRSVVLLTLSDRIAAVFRQLMRESYPDAKVDVVQEESGTDRLNSAASSADVFVVNTFDAKHAATGAVSKHRSDAAVTLFPKNKNAARQLDALEDWLRSVT